MKGDPYHAVYLSAEAIATYSLDANSSLFLGLKDNVSYFAIEIKSRKTANGIAKDAGAEMFVLRDIFTLLDIPTFSILALARKMAMWHMRTTYCGVCAHETEAKEGGHMRICPRCKQQYFPSMAPAVITVITYGDKILLANNANWPERKRYAIIAGFVESGESAEEAVAREAMEEVGVKVKNVRYWGTQSFLLTDSFMIGCSAEAEIPDLVVDEKELTDALWLSKEEILQKKESGEMLFPMNGTIAHRMISEWLGEEL